MRAASALVSTAEAVEADYAVPITNKRISVTPMALVTEPSRATRVVEAAVTLDRAAGELGVDYIGGFSALVEKAMTSGDRALVDSIPEALAVTKRRLLVGERGDHARRHQRRRRAGHGARDQGPGRAHRARGRHRLRQAVHVRQHPRRQSVRRRRHARPGRGRVRDQRRLLGPGRGAVGVEAAARVGRADEPVDDRRHHQAHGVQGHARRRADRPRGRAPARCRRARWQWRRRAARALRHRRSVAGAHAGGRRFGGGDPRGDGPGARRRARHRRGARRC